MKRTYRSKRKLRRFTRKRGGANASCENETKKAKYKISSCEALGFTTTMREAGLGIEYQKTSIAGIHDNGEQRPIEQLRELTFLGMADWWERKLGRRKPEQDRLGFNKPLKASEVRHFDFDSDSIRQISYAKKEKGDTPEDFKLFIDSYKSFPIDHENMEKGVEIFDTLDTLGAFYHRYKIVLERFGEAIDNLNKGVKGFFQKDLESGKYGFNGDMTPYEGTDSYERFSTDEHFPETIRTSFKVLADMVKDDILSKDFPIQIAIDRTQCVMFLIVKKAAIPKCFVMDKRIASLAKSIVQIGWGRSSLVDSSGEPQLQMTVAWLRFIQQKYNQLIDPPVTFNLFE